MKRTTRKLAVHRETIRALDALELVRVGGGGVRVVVVADGDSGAACVAVALAANTADDVAVR